MRRKKTPIRLIRSNRICPFATAAPQTPCTPSANADPPADPDDFSNIYDRFSDGLTTFPASF